MYFKDNEIYIDYKFEFWINKNKKTKCCMKTLEHAADIMCHQDEVENIQRQT